MPGGRLTQHERRQIASGLAANLAYAEIARRLDRPTSTVTREVMRNGGPADYRADTAQRAAEHRTRRRRRTAPREHGAPPRDLGRDTEAVREFEEALAGNFVEQGLPKMTARVLASLYTTEAGSMTAAELVGRLRVSPASISKAVAFLEGLGLVRRESDERRERYAVDNEVWYQSMIASVLSHARLVKIAQQGALALGPGTRAAARLEGIARFVDFVGESMGRAAEQAREVLHTGPDTSPGGAPEAVPEPNRP